MSEKDAKAFEPTDTTCLNPLRGMFGDIYPSHIKGTRIRISIPFTGERELFHYRPNQFTLSPPDGEVLQQEIQLVFDCAQSDPIRIKQDYQNTLASIRNYLEWIKNDVTNYNEQIQSATKQWITDRKRRISSDIELVKAIGIPIKPRESALSTYSTPIVRKHLIIKPPEVSKHLTPEPAIDQETYEDILEKLLNMSLAMERSPRTFAKLEEEEIRDFFLIILNAYYEGRASGETFNFAGKTDILIRENNRNVFIAECKFWRGEQEFLKTIDQLLGYLSWRDTKTAILLFNKNKNFSQVLEKIIATAPKHPRFNRLNKLKSQNLTDSTIFSLIFNQLSDVNRSLYLTILAFDVPTE